MLRQGEIVKTNYSVSPAITTLDAKGLKSKGWLFDWSLPQKNGNDVYALYRKGETRVEGMIALKIDSSNSAVYVDIVESAPHNRGSEKEFLGVGGHLFAIAAEQSYGAGFDGFVFFKAKTDLIAHYQKELGAKMVTGRVLAIDEQAAQGLLSKYELIKEDKR